MGPGPPRRFICVHGATVLMRVRVQNCANPRKNHRTLVVWVSPPSSHYKSLVLLVAPRIVELFLAYRHFAKSQCCGPHLGARDNNVQSGQ
jgi:hypothetical protein